MAVLKSPKKVRNKCRWVSNFSNKNRKNLPNLPKLNTSTKNTKNLFFVKKKHTNVDIQTQVYYVYNG